MLAGLASRWPSAGLGILVIWGAVLLMTFAAPDLISGSEQEHLPLVGLTAWIWGLFATGFVLLVAVTGGETEPGTWLAYGLVVAAAWAIAAAIAILAPSFVTGSDPTSIPLAGLVAPVGAVVATGYGSVLAAAPGPHPRTAARKGAPEVPAAA